MGPEESLGIRPLNPTDSHKILLGRLPGAFQAGKQEEAFIQFDTKYIPEFQNFIKMCGLCPLAVFTVREMNQIQ